MRAEQVPKGEVRLRFPGSIAQARLAGSQESAAFGDEGPDAGELAICQTGDVGENERGEPAAFALDMVRMDWQIRNARANECLRKAAPGLFHEDLGVVAAIEIGVLLRPNDTNGGDGLAIGQVLLIDFMPAVDGLDGVEGAAIFGSGAKMVPPRLDAPGGTFELPHSSFVGGFGTEQKGRASALIHGHAFGKKFVPAEQAVDKFAGLAIVLKTGTVAA